MAGNARGTAADETTASFSRESPGCAFEVYVEVVHPGTQSSEPAIRRKFPEDFQDEDTIKTIPKFCFPFCLDSVNQMEQNQNFTFVLTDINSKHRFGFCRLSSSLHTCYCILSYLPWFDVYYKLLNIVADYTIIGQEANFQDLLMSLHNLCIPEPGIPVHLAMHFYFTVPDLKELPRIPENRNLTEYFVAVDVNNMLQLYASMLYERRILICSSTLSTLTACVHGSAAMLYPMHWQHVYIPVLPHHLLDYCCAPMPYLIGVHSSLMEKVLGMAMEDIVILNVDTNTLQTPYNDLQCLPHDVVSSLKSRLRKFSTTPGDGVARAFLKSQAALFGSYRNALQIELKGSGAILNTVKTKANPAMKTVYKFAKDHAKMGIKEMKSRLKHKENIDNGSGIIARDNDFFAIKLKNEGPTQTLDEHRMNWQFGLTQSPMLLKKNKSHESLESSHYLLQRYCSLKDVESKEEHDCNLGLESPSRLPENLSNGSVGANFFNCVDEHDSQPLPVAKSLEDLKSLQGYRQLQAKFSSQRKDLHFCEHSPTPPSLKLPNTDNKLMGIKSDKTEIPSWEPPTCKKTQSDKLLMQVNHHNSNSSGLKLQDSSSPGNITIPRPHGRKSAEFGTVLAPLIGQSQSKSSNEERTKTGGEDFQKALSKTTDMFNVAEDHMDLISLLDPFNKSPQTSSASTMDDMNIEMFSSSCKTIPPRAHPMIQPPFQPHNHISPTVFTQPVKISLPQIQYMSGGRRTPFNTVYEPPIGSYPHNPTQPQSFPAVSEVYKQQLPGRPTLSPSYRMGNSSSLLHSSTSNRAISGLTNSKSVASTANTLPRLIKIEEDIHKSQDLFGDLLTMIKPTTPLQNSIDQLQKRWETFD
ncbi:DENN domain-containing protein 1A isoform X8 [Syngnathus scovelli]|uniref:DENN domain-containing protein 1A isoform X8 n=1 Tax=Syngnathus scovelli TaxID=161590 RepID=UPI00210FDE9B|nr:DENN domain-containing protein 1A isoform X7 [Syngnathus scovelli]